MILIKNVTILTMDRENPVINDGFVLTEGNKIKYVGETRPEFEGYEIDGKGKILMPGFVNAHTHVPMTLLRSYADGYELETWLFDKIFPVEDRLTADHIYWGTLLGIAEMIKSGTTSFSEMYYELDAILDAVNTSGIRANISRGASGNKDDWENSLKKLEETECLFEKWNGFDEDRIKIDLGIHSAYTSDEKFLKYAGEFAKEKKMHVHTHISETETENKNVIKALGKTPTRAFYDFGYFENGLQGAHCVYLNDEDMQIFKENNGFIVSCPTSNMKLGSGVAPLKTYLDNGINVSFGTDGASSNNSLNMISELKFGGLLMCGSEKNPSAVQAFDLLEMGTVVGAKTQGRENLGKIKEGYIADMIILDGEAENMIPKIHNPYNHIAYSAHAGNVLTSIINGKVVMEDRKLKFIDEADVKKNIERVCKELFV